MFVQKGTVKVYEHQTNKIHGCRSCVKILEKQNLGSFILNSRTQRKNVRAPRRNEKMQTQKHFPLSNVVPAYESKSLTVFISERLFLLLPGFGVKSFWVSNQKTILRLLPKIWEKPHCFFKFVIKLFFHY